MSQYPSSNALREKEIIESRRKKLAPFPSSIDLVPQAAAQPQAQPKSYTPSLTADEIRQKFMGGPATVPTGIPQQSAQNPAAPDTFPTRSERRAALSQSAQPAAAAPKIEADDALRNRVNKRLLQEQYAQAYRPGDGMRTNPFDPRLTTLGEDMKRADRAESNYQRQQSGRPADLGSPEEYAAYREAGQKRLQEQAARIAAERNGQPLPGSTDTWSYEAGQKALPKNLQGQVFTHPEDQANYRDFSRFVGGAPSIDPATGQMTTPADREYQNVQQMREREMLDRKRAGQPIDFAPSDYNAAVANRKKEQEFYDRNQALGNEAIGQIAEKRGLERSDTEAPLRMRNAISKAGLSEQDWIATNAEAAKGLLPGQTAAANADNQSKTVRSQYETANAGTMSARDVAKANEERARAEANAKAAPRRSDAEIRQIESGAGLSEAETNLRKKQLENYGRSGGPLDTATLSDDAANAVARRNAAKAMTGVDPVTIADKIIPKMASIARRFGGSRLVGKTGSVQDKTFGDMANELQDLKQIMGTGVGPLTDYAKVDPQGAKEVARGILANLPPPNENGQYEASWQLIGSPQMPEYVRLLNQFRASLEAMAR